MERATREPTLNEAVERRAAVLVVVETIVLIFAGLPAGLVFLAGAAPWRIGVYALGVGLGLASLAAAVLVFWPGARGIPKPMLLFCALALLVAALLVAAVWVFASVVTYNNEVWID